jgi:hypothetical protein
MKAMRWEELGICLTCSAIVPNRLMHEHDEWHTRIAEVAIETKHRIDRMIIGGA